MAWNEPGGGKRDPWGGKQPPADLEAILRRLRDGVTRLFGGGGGGGGGGAHGLVPLIIALIFFLWIAGTSWQSIDARQIGVVLRFGQFNRVMSSGFNLKWPAPIEHVFPVDATNVRSVSDEVRMLTKDENIVLIDFNVQYSVTDAREYLFAMNQPDQTLKQAAESALRQVIGRSEMDTILSGQGTALVQQTEDALRTILDGPKDHPELGYRIGLQVKAVNFQKILPPLEVKEAFDDANNAGNNQQEVINKAIAYKAQVVPVAEGEAARVRAEAEGYKAAQIAIATGDAARFSKVEEQYRAAPEVTRKRLYLETMQGAIGNSVKVLDSSNGKNLIYLPLDKLRGDAALNAAAADAAKKEGGQ